MSLAPSPLCGYTVAVRAQYCCSNGVVCICWSWRTFVNISCSGTFLRPARSPCAFGLIVASCHGVRSIHFESRCFNYFFLSSLNSSLFFLYLDFTRAFATRVSAVPSLPCSTGYTPSIRPPTTYRCGSHFLQSSCPSKYAMKRIPSSLNNRRRKTASEP